MNNANGTNKVKPTKLSSCFLQDMIVGCCAMFLKRMIINSDKFRIMI
nr:hypothetical protein CJLB15_00119 [Campylobacter phage CJLB-15]